MPRLRFFACAALALLALPTSACHRRRPPRYVPPPPGYAAPPDGPPGPPPDGPPGPPPAGPPGVPVTRPRVVRTQPPPPGTNRTLTVTGAAKALIRITQEASDDDTPALSPSGTVLLLEARTSVEGKVTQQRIIGVDPQNGGARASYSPSAITASAPAWLPDGGYIYLADSGGRRALVRSLAAAPNAATATVLSPDAAPDLSHPSPSPDGKRVVFEATLRGKTQIAISGMDGSGIHGLGEGQRPSWSPDGKRIVFTRTVLDYSQIFVINPDGSGLAQVTSDASDHDDPSWAPSSKLIVFNSNKGYDRQGGSWNLFVVKPDGTGLLQLTEGNSDTGAPSWGNDGWIYFDSNQAGSYDIWRTRPTGEVDTLGNRR